MRRMHEHGRSGFSLVEAVISVAIVGGLFIAALNTLGSVRSSQLYLADQVRAQLLAQELLAEILDQPYSDPDDGAEFGPTAYESAVASRERFDDVDDYHGWIGSPPQHRDGSTIAGLSGWSRSVRVEYVSPVAGGLGNVLVDDQGVKRITVTVRRGEKVLSEMTALRTRGWPTGRAMNEGLMP